MMRGFRIAATIILVGLATIFAAGGLHEPAVLAVGAMFAVGAYFVAPTRQKPKPE